MNKAIKYILRRFMVPAIVLTVVLIAVPAISIFPSSFKYNTEDPYSLFTVTPSIISVASFIMVFAASAAAGIIAMEYKFGMQRADYYGQLPFKPKHLRRYFYIAGLIMTAVTLLVGLLLTALFVAIRYNIDKGSLSSGWVMRPMNWQYIWLGLLFTFGYGIANYCISATILDQNIGIFESIINIILFQVVLSLLTQAPTLIIGALKESELYNLGFGVVNIALYGVKFDAAIFNGLEVTANACEIISIVGSYVIAILAFLWAFFRKDVSAEKENTKGRPCVFPIVTLHLAAFAIAMISSLISLKNPNFLLWPLIIYGFVLAAYFFLHVIYNHGFKLKKMQWIPIPLVTILGFAFIIIFAFVK